MYSNRFYFAVYIDDTVNPVYCLQVNERVYEWIRCFLRVQNEFFGFEDDDDIPSRVWRVHLEIFCLILCLTGTIIFRLWFFLFYLMKMLSIPQISSSMHGIFLLTENNGFDI